MPYTPYNSGSPFQAVLGTARARADASSARTYSWGGYGGYLYYDKGYQANTCTGYGYICMGNANKGMVFPATSPTLTPTAQNDSFRSASLESGERSYDEASHTMVIYNLKATLRNNPFDKANEYSALHLSVLRSPDAKSDSLNSNDDKSFRTNVLTSSRVMLNNGSLLVDGVLQKAHIETQDSAGYQIVHITMPEVRMRVTQDVSPEEVVLNMATDVGMLSDGVSVRYMPDEEHLTLAVAEAKVTSEALDFISSPNPATPQSNASVEALVQQAEAVKIGLYRENSTLAIPVYSGDLIGNERRSFPLDLHELTPGTYYLRLERSRSVLTRRVIIQ